MKRVVARIKEVENEQSYDITVLNLLKKTEEAFGQLSNAILACANYSIKNLQDSKPARIAASVKKPSCFSRFQETHFEEHKERIDTIETAILAVKNRLDNLNELIPEYTSEDE